MWSDQGEMTTCAFVRARNWAGRKNSSNKPANKSSGGPCSPNSTGAPTPIKSFGRNPASRTLHAPTPPPIEWPMKTSTAPSARSSSPGYCGSEVGEGARLRRFSISRLIHGIAIKVHPAEACAGLEKSGHADSNWSCVQGLQTGRSACPPACCITPSASAATSTPAPTIEGGPDDLHHPPGARDLPLLRLRLATGHPPRPGRAPLPIPAHRRPGDLRGPAHPPRRMPGLRRRPPGRGPLRRPAAELHHAPSSATPWSWGGA